MYYPCSENKGADQLRGSASLFSPMQIVGFPTRGLKCYLYLEERYFGLFTKWERRPGLADIFFYQRDT